MQKYQNITITEGIISLGNLHEKKTINGEFILYREQSRVLHTNCYITTSKDYAAGPKSSVPLYYEVGDKS